MPTENPQAPAAEVDALDTTAEQQELDALTAELEQNAASLEADFAAFAAENTTPELEDLFFSDRAAFYAQILAMQNAFLENGIRKKQQRANQLQGDIAQKQNIRAIDEAANAFMKDYPDADIPALLEFMANEIPPRKQKELESLAPYDLFKALYELQKGSAEAPKEAPKENKLPERVSGAPMSVSPTAQPIGNDLPFDRI